jgi:hypothetical protein
MLVPAFETIWTTRMVSARLTGAASIRIVADFLNVVLLARVRKNSSLCAAVATEKTCSAICLGLAADCKRLERDMLGPHCAIL